MAVLLATEIFDYAIELLLVPDIISTVRCLCFEL